MKKPNRRGGPASKMVMAGLVLATTVGFVSGLTRNVSSADGDSSVWSYVQSFFDGPYGNRKIATQSDQSAAPRTQSVTRFYTPVSTDKPGIHPVLAPREITLVEPVTVNTTGVDANGSVTFDSNVSIIATHAMSSASFNSAAGTSPSKSRIAAPNSGAPDLFWRTDGTTGLLWTGTNWSNPATATGGTAWVSGDDAFFTANSSLTFATTTVSDVTVADGVTVTVAAAGTLTLGGVVRIFDIGTGSTLTWQSQTVTANSAAGITKNGAGTLDLGALTYATNMNGGFTLNNGTLIVSGDKALGNGALNLNGGTLQSSGTRSFAVASIAIGGDFAFAGTGNSTWAAPVSLGSATYTITNNTTSTATRTFSGAISGTGGLTFAGTGGSGGIVFSGANANTYSGATTVNSGLLNLSKTSTVNAIAGNLNIGDGVGAANSATVTLINSDQIADTSDVSINSDGLFNLNGKNETIDALNGVTGSSVTLGSGTLTVGANNDSGANFHGVISGTGGFIKTGTGTQILSGTNLYSGDTQILSGDLRFDSGGTSNSSTIRLGDTSGTNTATLSLGVASGNNVASALEVRAGSSGTKVLRSVATSGTNTYSGAITLNTGLTLEAISNGNVSASTLLLQGGSVDVKTNTLTVDTQVDFNGANSVNAQGNVTINEVLGSSSTTGGALVKDGSNTLILQGTTNTYTGTDATALNANGTTIKDGVLAIFDDLSLGKAPSSASNNVFFATSSLTSATNTPTLRADANGIVLASTRSINIASGVTARFDSNGNTFNIAGDINGAGNLNKIGNGTLALIGSTSYTGTTMIDAGTLSAATTNALGSTGSGTSGITVNSGGTLLLAGNTNDRINDNATMKLNGQGSATVSFDTGGLSEHGVANNNAGIGALTLQSSSIIDMGTGASIIAFANSLAQSGNWNGTLSIYNWSGNPGPTGGNGTDQLYFGNDATGLSLSQLAQFQFYSGNGTGAYTPGALILADGEVVAPIPEPSTWIGAALALAAIGWTQRKRFGKRLRVIR